MAATHEAETEVGFLRQRGVGGTQLEDVSPCSRFCGLGARRTLRKAWGLIVVSWSPSTQARVTSVSDQRNTMSPPAPTEITREVSCTATSVRIGGGCVGRGCSTSVTIARIAARVPPAVERRRGCRGGCGGSGCGHGGGSEIASRIALAEEPFAPGDLSAGAVVAASAGSAPCAARRGPAVTDGASRFTHIHARVLAGRQTVSERARLCMLDETLSSIAASDLIDEGVLRGASLLFTIRTCRPRGGRRVRPPKPRGPR